MISLSEEDQQENFTSYQPENGPYRELQPIYLSLQVGWQRVDQRVRGRLCQQQQPPRAQPGAQPAEGRGPGGLQAVGQPSRPSSRQQPD